MVPRLLSGSEARVGEVSWVRRLPAAVLLPGASRWREAAVVGAAVVEGGSVQREREGV